MEDQEDPRIAPGIRLQGSRPFGTGQPLATPAQPSSPAVAPDKVPQASSGPSFTGSADVTPKAKPAQQPSMLEDVSRTFVGYAPKAITGTIFGGIGSVGKGVADLGQMGRNAYYSGMTALDRMSPDEAARLKAQPLVPPLTQADAEGNTFLGVFPTYKGVTSYMTDLSKQGMLSPELSYEPKTSAGEYARAFTEGAAQGLPGAFRGMAGRMVSSGLTSTAGEAGRQAAQPGTAAETWAPIISSLLGGVGASKLVDAASALRPSGVAQDRLMEALANDLRRDPSRVEQMRQAQANGLPISVYDYAGPETRQLLEQAAATSGKGGLSKSGAINQFVEDRATTGRARSLGKLGEAIGIPVGDIDARRLADVTEKAGQIERDRIYSLMKADPAANDIYIGKIDPRITSLPQFQEAVQDANDIMVRAPHFKMVAPSGGAFPTPGNIAYFDQVQRSMREAAEKLDRSGDFSRSNAIKNTRQALLDDLENMIPGYGAVRSKAAETFGSAAAPEAGQRFFSSANSFKRRDIEDALRSYTDDQRQLFKVGFADALVKQMDQENGLTAVYKKFQNGDFVDRARMALGDDAFDALQGHVASEMVLRKVKSLSPPVARDATKLNAATGSALGGLGTIGLEALYNSAFTGPKVAAGLAAGAAYGAIKSKADQLVGRRMLDLALSQDPKKIQQLGTLLSKEPSLNRIFNKMTANLAQVEQEAAQSFIPQSAPAAPAPPVASPANTLGAETIKMLQEQGFMQGQASGGRVGYRSGGRILDHGSKADALVRAAESARKTISGTTEPLLDLPDEHVVKALAVAGEAI